MFRHRPAALEVTKVRAKGCAETCLFTWGGGAALRRVCNVEATTRPGESRVIHVKSMMTVPLKCQSARPASQFIEVLSVVFQCVHLKHVHSYDTQLAAR